MAARLIREEGRVTIRELLGSGDQPRLESMLEMYARLFPQYAHYVPRMRRRAAFGAEHRPGHIVHYWLAEVDGRPAGLRTFRYVRYREAGLAHALAVDPSYRDVQAGGRRLSMFLVHACLEQVTEDARRTGEGPPRGMVNEVDSPRLMQHYKRNGLQELPVKYVEPIFPAGQAAPGTDRELELIRFAPMILGFLPNPAAKTNGLNADAVADFASAFLIDHYGLPADHPQVRAVLDSIPDSRGALHG
jgi:GNAT superfamily N-acetyltransferase